MNMAWTNGSSRTCALLVMQVSLWWIQGTGAVVMLDNYTDANLACACGMIYVWANLISVYLQKWRMVLDGLALSVLVDEAVSLYMHIYT